ncbi:hypothetical protein XELAEV_18012793mg [Xenopus laevis]|uniref:Uncharacterized protein n=1 Tax=Xenopus laevis TaxID=8355 RepID=A0A974DNB3_XENLA|nr:hypothetical protein XELAEV_18012793mg [Xenopus laevis]
MVSAPNGKYLLWCSISSATVTRQLASLVLRLCYALNPGFSADTCLQLTVDTKRGVVGALLSLKQTLNALLLFLGDRHVYLALWRKSNASLWLTENCL